MTLQGIQVVFPKLCCPISPTQRVEDSNVRYHVESLLIDFLSSSAEALLEDGQAAAAERLLRQALQSAYDPLGPSTYGHACFTQRLNLLRGWGSEVREERCIPLEKCIICCTRHL